MAAGAAPLLREQGLNVTQFDTFAYFDAAESRFVILRTLEDRPYGNLILRKDVVCPD